MGHLVHRYKASEETERKIKEAIRTPGLDGLKAYDALIREGILVPANGHEIFMEADGRRLRRIIDMPNPAYQEGKDELNTLVQELLKANHLPSIVAALGSLEVDLSYYQDLDTGLTKEWRQQHRVISAMEMLAKNFSSFDSANTILHATSLEPIRPAIESVSSHMVKLLAKDPLLLHSLSSRQFEQLVAEILVGFGWEVELTAASKDGGYDLFAVSRNTDGSGLRTSYIVECKKYRPDRKVGVEIARQLFHVKSEKNASQAILATTSDFTQGVYDYKVSRLDLETRNFAEIAEWCKSYPVIARDLDA